MDFLAICLDQLRVNKTTIISSQNHGSLMFVQSMPSIVVQMKIHPFINAFFNFLEILHMDWVHASESFQRG
jgi:hypothetical protein